MSPIANAHWRIVAKSHWGTRIGMACGVLITGAAAAQYLAGYFFLWWFHQSPLRATPLTILQYATYYGRAPLVRHRLMVCSGVGVILVAAAGSMALFPRPRSLHGDARFERRSQVARAGWFGERGIILGRLGSRILVLPGQQSVFLAAPPRSGKDVGVAIPNGLNWPGSLVQVDIKKENWDITAGYRASRGQRVYRFEPLNPFGDTARTNPLSYVSRSTEHRIDGIQRIADMLYTETPGTDPFWIASARSLFLGVCLYLFETPGLPKTIGEVRRQGMAMDDEGFGAHWKRIIQGRQKGSYPLSDECVRALADVIDLAPVTASSVRKTFVSRLELWANPLLDAATSADDFDFRDLRKAPISIYVCVNPDDLHRLRPLLSLFFQQLIGQQTTELPEHNPTLKHQILLILNEFTALGRIPIVSESMSYLPGYNVRLLLIIQSASQLRDVYGVYTAETMLKSAAARIVFAPKDYADAKEISDDLGFTTVRVRSHSRPSVWASHRAGGRSGSTTDSLHARALLLPQEVKELGTENALIFYEGLRPVKCQKIRYYADARFRQRLLPPPAQATPHARVAKSMHRSPNPVVQTPPTEVLNASMGGQAWMAEDVDVPSDVQTLIQDLDDRLKDLNFEHAGEHPTDSELDSDVDQFLAAIR